MEREEKREEYAYVLDFLNSGKSFSSRSEPIAQLLGNERFTMLEATVKPGTTVTAGEKVYIGKEERKKIMLIKSRISYDQLTPTAKSELDNAVMRIINESEPRFVEVFNIAAPLNIREHSLELLPGVGKKYLEAILKARNEKKFESFSDISARVALIQDPAKLIKERVVAELKGNERFYMFTKPYRRIER